MNLIDTKYCYLNGPLSEIPKSTTEYDSLIESNVRFNRESTTFSRKLQVSSLSDFEAIGLVELLL